MGEIETESMLTLSAECCLGICKTEKEERKEGIWDEKWGGETTKLEGSKVRKTFHDLPMTSCHL